jgi:hypothetical protein
MPDKTRRLVTGVALNAQPSELFKCEFKVLAGFVNSKNQQLAKHGALYAA